jgi:hypothetical protein
MVSACFLLFGFYTLTSPRNHSEANDALGYALTVEQAPASQLWHSQHLLYFPVAKGLYFVAHHLGLAERSFPVMLWFSRLCGVLAVLVVFLLLYQRNLTIPTALAGALALAFTYGFWRYSNEAEIYAPAMLLNLLAWRAVTGVPTWTNVILGAVLAALACLLHLLNVVPALIALPVFYLLEHRRLDALVHLAVVGGLTAVAYLACFGAGVVQAVLAVGADQPEGGLYLASFAKGAVALAQNLVAGNFLFASEQFQHALQELFPYRALARQIFTGQHADALSRTAPYVTLALLALAGLVLLVQRSRVCSSGLDTAFRGALRLWLGLHVLIVLLTEPGGPENWVMGLPPLVLLVVMAVFVPLAAAGRTVLPLVCVALLALHNYFGAFRLLADERGDLAACKSAWLVQHARPGDLILNADTFEVARHLAYYSRAEVTHLIYAVTPANEEEFLAGLARRSGRVWATADVFALPASLQRRFPQRADFLAALGRKLAPRFTPAATNEFGAVFVLQPPR